MAKSVLVLMLVMGLPAAQAADRDSEPEIAAADPDTATYLHAVHARVHERWVDNFLRLADVKLSVSNPLNSGGRVAQFRLVLGHDGTIQELVLEKGSGFAGFDDAAREVLRDSAPFPEAPAAVLSDDDRVHLHWMLARDRRACGGLRLDRVSEPDDRALPRMIHLGYVDEAVRRTGAACARQGFEAGMTLLAQSWLREAIRGPLASVRAAELLLAAGDADAGPWLERALADPNTAADAAAVLRSAGRPLCSLVRPALEGFDERRRHAAALALQRAEEPACAPGLIALLQDRNAGIAARVAAAAALGNLPEMRVVTALDAALSDEDPRLRGAAHVALVRARRPGRHIAVVYLMTDGRPAERLQAALVLARSNIGKDLEQLVFLSDPEAAIAVSGILARNGEPEAVRALAHMLTSKEPEVRIAAARALLERRDRSLLHMLGKHMGRNEPRELQALALAAASAPQIAQAAATAGWGFAAYRAWLAKGERERAGRWLLDNLPQLPAPLQLDAMCDWLAWAGPTD